MIMYMIGSWFLSVPRTQFLQIRSPLLSNWFKMKISFWKRMKIPMIAWIIKLKNWAIEMTNRHNRIFRINRQFYNNSKYKNYNNKLQNWSLQRLLSNYSSRLNNLLNNSHKLKSTVYKEELKQQKNLRNQKGKGPVLSFEIKFKIILSIFFLQIQ